MHYKLEPIDTYNTARKQTDIHTDRHKDRQTDRHTDRHTSAGVKKVRHEDKKKKKKKNKTKKNYSTKNHNNLIYKCRVFVIQ